MDAVATKNALLVFCSVAGSYVAQALGGWDASLKVLIAMMAADYITGVLVAAVWKKSAKSENGALDSRAGFKGLVKKGAILLIVWISVLLDEATGSVYIAIMVKIFFIGNEGLSLLEKFGLMGVPYPASRYFRSLRHVVSL